MIPISSCLKRFLTMGHMTSMALQSIVLVSEPFDARFCHLPAAQLFDLQVGFSWWLYARSAAESWDLTALHLGPGLQGHAYRRGLNNYRCYVMVPYSSHS